MLPAAHGHWGPLLALTTLALLPGQLSCKSQAGPAVQIGPLLAVERTSSQEHRLKIPVRFHLGRSVDLETIKQAINRVDGCLQRQGIFIVEAAPARRLTNLGPILTMGAPESTEPDPNPQRIATERVYAPLGAIIERLSTPRQPWVNVIVVDRIATADSMAMRVLGDIHGLGFAPGAHPELGLPTTFTPTVMVTASLKALGHELGHALGLPHDETSAHADTLSPQLMATTQQQPPCDKSALTPQETLLLSQRLARLKRNLP